MGVALARHDAILREVIEAHGGTVIKSTGDGGYAVFGSAPAAVAACAAAARVFASESWGETGRLRARTGIHSGVAEQRDGDYFGPTLDRASRLMTAAHGEQIVISQRTAELVRDALSDDLMLLDLGEHRFAGLARTERVYQLAVAGLASRFPPLQSRGAFPGALALPAPSFARTDEPIVGRGAEIDRLVGFLGEINEGRRRIALIGGEPGIGKTRLAAELARRARSAGALVLYGRCDEEPTGLYQPFVEALRPAIAACPARASCASACTAWKKNSRGSFRSSPDACRGSPSGAGRSGNRAVPALRRFRHASGRARDVAADGAGHRRHALLRQGDAAAASSRRPRDRRTRGS